MKQLGLVWGQFAAQACPLHRPAARRCWPVGTTTLAPPAVAESFHKTLHLTFFVILFFASSSSSLAIKVDVMPEVNLQTEWMTCQPSVHTNLIQHYF
jgi:hypothetical protein